MVVLPKIKFPIYKNEPGCYSTCLWYQTLKNGVNELKKAVAETCRSFLCIMNSLELLI